MNYVAKILTNFHQKFPSGKVDLRRILSNSDSPIPRKLKISGHFRLKTPKKSENQLRNSLIF